MLTRRDALSLFGGAALAPAAIPAMNSSKSLRVRTITAGVSLDNASQADRFEKAIATLKRGRAMFEQAGYEVETTRIATNPFVAGLSTAERDKVLPRLEALDRIAAESGVIVSIGPVLSEDRDDSGLAAVGARVRDAHEDDEFLRGARIEASRHSRARRGNLSARHPRTGVSAARRSRELPICRSGQHSGRHALLSRGLARRRAIDRDRDGIRIGRRTGIPRCTTGALAWNSCATG